MEGRRKKASHSCTGPGVGRGKCIFSGRIVRFLHMGVSDGNNLRVEYFQFSNMEEVHGQVPHMNNTRRPLFRTTRSMIFTGRPLIWTSPVRYFLANLD